MNHEQSSLMNKKLTITLLAFFIFSLCFAGYTRVIVGNSVTATITSSQKSLKQLMIDGGLIAAEAPNSEVNRVLVSFEGDPTAPAIVARFSNDPDATIASGVGRAIISLEERIFTVNQFDTIFIAEGADVDVFIEQYDHKQDRL